MSPYEVYTLRRTSTRTVYAVYGHDANLPYSEPGKEAPWTTTDRVAAEKKAAALNAAEKTKTAADLNPGDIFQLEPTGPVLRVQYKGERALCAESLNHTGFTTDYPTIELTTKVYPKETS